MPRRYVEAAGTAVAAGAGFTFRPSTADRFRVLCVAGQYVTSSHVANRQALLTLEDQSGNVLYQKGVVGTQAASLTYQYSWSSGSAPAEGGSATADLTISDGLPDWWLPAGTQLLVSMTNVDTADQWTNTYAQFLVGDETERLHELASLIADYVT